MKRKKKLLLICLVALFFLLASSVAIWKHYYDRAKAEAESTVRWSECSDPHELLDVDGVSMEIVDPIPTQCSDAAVYIRVINNSDYYLTGQYRHIEKRVGEKWLKWSYKSGTSETTSETTALFRNKITDLSVLAHTEETDDIPFGAPANPDALAFLPEREPGEYRVIWEGYAEKRVGNHTKNIAEGTLIATFTLE